MDKNGKRLPSTAWEPGVSGNPKGRPAEGQSWAAVIKECSDLTPEEVLTAISKGSLARSFKEMPRKVQIKHLVVLRSIAQLMFDPQASMLNAFMDREDGKVADKLEMRGELNVEGFDKVLDKVYKNGNGKHKG